MLALACYFCAPLEQNGSTWPDTRRVTKKSFSANQQIRVTLVETCDTSTWTHIKNGVTCGFCKVLAGTTASGGYSCDHYCAVQGHECVGAWEEVADNCVVKSVLTCDTNNPSSDTICECAPTTQEGVAKTNLEIYVFY